MSTVKTCISRILEAMENSGCIMQWPDEDDSAEKDVKDFKEANLEKFQACSAIFLAEMTDQEKERFEKLNNDGKDLTGHQKRNIVFMCWVRDPVNKRKLANLEHRLSNDSQRQARKIQVDALQTQQAVEKGPEKKLGLFHRLYLLIQKKR